jgi:hypothetical protein
MELKMSNKITQAFEEEFSPMKAEIDKQWFGTFKAGYEAGLEQNRNYRYFIREIGEGDWQEVTYSMYAESMGSPHIDYKREHAETQAALSAVPANHSGDCNEMVEPTDISKQLREYAEDSGYSHNDYADTMLAAASEIERCAARLESSQAQQPAQEPMSKDWKEDFEHENGTYQNKCGSCDSVFLGHKRRVVCKVCAQEPVSINTWQEVSKQFAQDRRAMATNQMIWMQQEIDELRAALEALQETNAAQAKRIEEQLEVIEATAEFAKAFWEKSDKHRDTRVMVSTFQQLEQKLRTYIPKNGVSK